jgi:DNA-directed RNA polymerase subunit beta'
VVLLYVGQIEEVQVLPFHFHYVRGLRISLASSDEIYSWSSGEVTKAETINYRTFKPDPGGLFCERIFGPTKNWRCACGKYKQRQYKGRVCEKCGVMVEHSRVRRTRMGHIKLAVPVGHVWYVQGLPSRLSLLLDLSPRELKQILMYTHYIVLDVDEQARRGEIQHVKLALKQLETEPRPLVQVGAPAQEQASRQEVPDTFVQAWSDDDTLDDEVMDLAERKRVLEGVLRDLTSLARHSLLEASRYQALEVECGQVFHIAIGAEAIQEMLADLDLDELAHTLRSESVKEEGPKRTKAIKRLKVIEAFRRSGIDPQNMILSVLPVLPPDLRPLITTQSGRFASTDINELYCRVLHRNERLKQLQRMGALDSMINHEKRMLQEACDALLDNARCAKPVLGARKRALRSLSDNLRGKRGFFRHNMLGKRVDYSGRSVICVGRNLKLYQCGLPKKIALELFKPFVISKLLAYDVVQTTKQAKKAVEQKHPAVWDILEEVMSSRVVLLNRAPTLHRLSIQAFEPILIEGNAIHLHPLVCSAFNADFDGDQMAVHLPLSRKAQQEARELMLSTRNLLSPASGEPTVSISQEMVLGCFYLTQERPGKKGAGRIFTDSNEAILAYESGIVELQARIQVRLQHDTLFDQPPPAPAQSHPQGCRITTTVGRLIFNAVLPKRLRFKNYAMTKDLLKQLMWECIRAHGVDRTAVLGDEIKRLGFTYATKAGISFAISDVSVPPRKKEVLAEADEQLRELSEEWSDGMITREERYERTIALWTKTTDRIAEMVQESLDPFGSVATIARSGATKAKLQQIRQLSGMRGLMASPSGEVIETPVRGNFLEGLTAAEYFLSSHGARKSLMDRSLNTAEAGYLTIRFVNSAQDVIVTEEDCGTTRGLQILAEDCAYMGLTDSKARLLGRVLAEALPQIGLSAGDDLGEERVGRILAAKLPAVRVRSALACQAHSGVCQTCYGWDLSIRSRVRLGTAVGIIAAQSIGEPGTQLTMRTFHSGGIAGGQGDITQGLPRVEELFEARPPKERALLSEGEGEVDITKDEESGIRMIRVIPFDSSSEIQTYKIPHGRTLLVSDGQQVRIGDQLTAGALDLQDVLRLQGVEALERYLLKEAQRVYRTTGAYIHDQHFEIIISQMVRYVQVMASGDTHLLPGNLIDRRNYSRINAQIVAEGGDPATAKIVLLGLTRAALATESWLAAASFQRTDSVLADAAIEGRIDRLVGLKENVILGKLIPAGTGHNPPPPVLPVRKQPAKRGRPPGSKNGQ